MARPRGKTNRNRWVSFRLTEKEALVLEARAKRVGQGVSRYSRMALLGDETEQEAEVFGHQEGVANSHEVKILVEQVRRVGVNLNQIAKQLHALRLDAPLDLPGLLTEVSSNSKSVPEVVSLGVG